MPVLSKIVYAVRQLKAQYVREITMICLVLTRKQSDCIVSRFAKLVGLNCLKNMGLMLNNFFQFSTPYITGILDLLWAKKLSKKNWKADYQKYLPSSGAILNIFFEKKFLRTAK